MTEDQKELVRKTWTMAAADPDAAARLFYGHLFEVAPQVKPMFKGDMVEQGRKLMKTIDLAVSSLDDLEKLVPALEALGRKHVEMGVETEQYDVVGGALLWTLDTALGDAFGEPEKAAWAETYGIVANVMKNA